MILTQTQIEYTEVGQFIVVSLAMFTLIVGAFLYLLGRLNDGISSVTNKREDGDRQLWGELNKIKDQRGQDAVNVTKALGSLDTTLGKMNTTLEHMNDSLMAVKKDVDELKEKK